MSFYRNNHNEQAPFELGMSSPLSSNSGINNGYNNLSLSSRANGTSNGFFARDNVGSPSLNFTSLYSNRARFNVSKGFELEDDLEFCPEIHEIRNNHFTHHKFNPYTTTTYSPQVSPTLSNNNASPTTKTTTPINKNVSPASPRVITPRAKKVLEIVNPVTGLRVSSPAPYK